MATDPVTVTRSPHGLWALTWPMTRTRTAAEVDPQLIAFMLPSVPESVRIARFHIRAALGFHQLGEYADDTEAITSELVTNAVQHAGGDGTGTVRVALVRIRNPDAVTVVVSDSSPEGPVTRASHRAAVNGDEAC